MGTDVFLYVSNIADFVCFESLGGSSDYAPKEKASAITSIRILTYIIYSRWIVCDICRILSFAAIFTSYEVFYIRHESLQEMFLISS